MMKPKTRVLGTFTLAMLSVSAILNLRGLPMMASVGLEAIFFYVLAALLFLIPSSLVCAELATSYPESGGVYTWVRSAFGQRVGFLAIWMEWINNTIAFPATLSTIVTTLAYAGLPTLDRSPWVLFGIMMLVFWGCTFFNFFGIRTASKLNIIGALFGTILPGVAIIGLGIDWLASGHHIMLGFSQRHYIPSWHVGDWVFFLAVLSGYSGMQVTAFHAPNVKNPRHTFPRSILMATGIIIILSILGALSIAVVVPAQHVNLMNGVIQGFAYFFAAFHLVWVTPILAVLIAIGGIASMSAWVLGPARGMLVAAEEGLLPRWWQIKNRFDMPIFILLLQGVIGTLLASVFLFMPSLKSAFWVLVALTSQFTVLMYILVFLATLRLRYVRRMLDSRLRENDKKEDGNDKVFHIPGGRYGIWVVCGGGILACAIGFLLGLFPPAALHLGDIRAYIILMLGIDGVILGLPIYLLRRKT